jgi:hypothetical protein
MIKPSLAHPSEYRRAFETAETIIDTEADGGPLVGVAIANIPLLKGLVAQCELFDFNRLMDGRFSDQWWAHSNGHGHFYVRTTRLDAPSKTFNVARLIMRCPFGTRLRYLDGNPLNLRRSNLKVGDGCSKGLEAAALDEIMWD